MGALVFASGALASPARAAPPIVVEHIDLIDFPDGEAHRFDDASLVIADGRIVYAGPAAAAPSPAGAKRIDASGKTAIPGLTDMHVHVWDEAGLGAYLAYGVTTVRNMSGMPFHLALAERIANGELAGPRLLTSGPILNSKGPNAQINHQVVETAEEARKAVAAQAAAGFTRLKTYSNLRRPAYEALLDEARAHDLKITGHTPEGFRAEGVPFDKPFAIGFEEILDDGFETIEHTESILWHGLSDRLDEDAARVLARKIAASGTPVTATLLAHHNLVRVAESDGAFAKQPDAATLNPVTQQTETEYIAFWAKQDAARHLEKDRFIGTFTRIMDEEGVTIVTGSDAGIFTNAPGVSLVDELELLVAAGFSPTQALAASTNSVAGVLGLAGESGCLAAQCRADVVLYACDPTQDIACTHQPFAVVADGTWHDRAALDAMLAKAARPDVERTIANLVEGMAAQGTPLDPAVLGN
ncbi:hypothetical protein B2G71_07975 [Novosphingobium sp. PC22D]|nr:hypothetical protein B2G71_07975 [Novosphingobium sp. PC22D]